jgi:ribulose-5-phosphate 4-epimerase/fuculose-1-phosphate aldolase
VHADELAELRRTIALGCRILGQTGLAEDVLGHISVRTEDDRILLRCRGPREEGLLFTNDTDVREVDLDGNGKLGDWRVPNELPIHAEILRRRPDVDAVVHCHPPSVLAAAVSDVELRPVFGAYHIPAARLARDGIPVYPRSVLVRTPELGREVAEALGGAPVLVLRGHGIATVGSGPYAVPEAVLRALAVETLARVNLACAAVGGAKRELSDVDAAELPDLGGSFNVEALWRHYVARLRQAGLSKT